MACCVRPSTLAVACVLSGFSFGCLRPRRGPSEAERAAQTALPTETRNAADDSVLLLVQGGEFIMGAPGQARRVVLKPFYMDRLEVTNAQYAKFLAAVAKQGDAAWRHPDQPATKKTHVPSTWANADIGEAKASHPVVGVDWFDAYAYAKWADKRLATEAEWEKAARGTDGRVYPWGAAPPEQRFIFRANFFGTYLDADGFRYTAPVGKFPVGASPCGCLDMAGNAAEWCADWFGPPPAEPELADPAGPPAGTERVTKGGGWSHNAESLRSANRWPMAPSDRAASVGFRCAKDAPLEVMPPLTK